MFSFMFLLMSGPVWAQFNTAEITGSVKDIADAVLPGATVIAVHSGTGFRSEQFCDANGEFLLANLPVGQYTVSVDFPGFKRITQSLALVIGQKARLDFAMEVGSVSEEITVLESTPLLQTGNAEVSDVIENQRIVNLPLNGRQFMDLALLSDNVIKPPAGTRGSA